jgi:hypothetical protein
MSQVARQAVNRLGEHGIQLLRLPGRQETKQAGPVVERRPRDRSVEKLGYNLPALAGRVIPSGRNLVRYRSDWVRKHDPVATRRARASARR